MKKTDRTAINDIVQQSIGTPITEEEMKKKIQEKTNLGKIRTYLVTAKIGGSGWPIPSENLGTGFSKIYGKNTRIKLKPAGEQEGTTTYRGILPTDPRF